MIKSFSKHRNLELTYKLPPRHAFCALSYWQLDPDQLEWAYTPIIQSGGNYDLRPSALSDTNNLHGGVVLASLGVRYKSYCSNVGRTYLFDPTKDQEKHYNFLVSLQKKVFETIKDGAVIKDVYTAAIGQVRAKMPELEPKFVRNLGSGIGIEFRDSATLLNAKNTRVLRTGMTLNMSIGFNDLENPGAKNSKDAKYSLLLVDTLIVTPEGPHILTDSPKDTNAISFYIKDSDSDVAPKKAPPTRSEKRGEAKTTARDRTRGAVKDADESNEQLRREHQKELHAQKQREGLARFKEGGGDANGANGPQIKKFESYKRVDQLPPKVKDLRIVVDTRNQTIIVPIYGLPVPFHINTLRNASKNDEGDYVYLRLNFLTPGQGIGKQDTLVPKTSLFGLTLTLTAIRRPKRQLCPKPDVPQRRLGSHVRHLPRNPRPQKIRRQTRSRKKGNGRRHRTRIPARNPQPSSATPHGRLRPSISRQQTRPGRTRDPRKRSPLPVPAAGGLADRFAV
jgi:nucleosome binding factor SPN SPT16 subunit